MVLLFVLSKQHLDLAVAEVLSIAKTCTYEQHEHLFLVDCTYSKKFLRLAYTKKICKVLFFCVPSQFEKKFNDFNFKKVYVKSFSARIFGKEHVPFSERTLGGNIGKMLVTPLVNLKHPTTAFELHTLKNFFVMSTLVHEFTYSFDDRKGHKRPSLHPSTLHPQLARCLVNLTGIEHGKILDPFCGSGGILLEAGLLGFEPIGYDIDPEMIIRARKNLDYFHLKNYMLACKDATTIHQPFSYMATDLPYGVNTKKVSYDTLYNSFLTVVKKYCRKKAVICFPDFFDYNPLLKKLQLTKQYEFTYYLHKSLSKKIVVIDLMK